ARWPLDDADRRLDKRTAALVEGGGGDRDLPPALPDLIQIDDDLPRVWVERLLLPPTFLEQAKPLARRERGERRLVQRHLRERLIEIVSAERTDALATDYGVDFLVELNQRRVEGPAAQSIDEEATAEVLAVAKLCGRRRRLVKQTEYLKSGSLEGVDRQEPLVAVGVGRHPEHDLEGPVEAQGALQFARHPHQK